MSLFSAERTTCKNNPLVEVVCQLRFPRILSIDEFPPADFQDRIRAEYPLFEAIVEQPFISNFF